MLVLRLNINRVPRRSIKLSPNVDICLWTQTPHGRCPGYRGEIDPEHVHIGRTRLLARGDILQFRHGITQSREICRFRFRIRNRLFGKGGRRRIALDRPELLQDSS